MRRFFLHAIRAGSAPPDGVRLTMSGSIKVGVWLPFRAEQSLDGRSFAWRAKVGPLSVVDRYADGAGRTEGRLLGRVRLFGAGDENTTRSAAGRAALEAVAFSPGSVLPDRGVDWRAEADDRIVARFDLPPERPEVHVAIDGDGAVRNLYALRWGNAGQKTWGYIPCGCEVHTERRFGDLVLPAAFSVGWWFGTPRYAPFFRAELESVSG